MNLGHHTQGVDLVRGEAAISSERIVRQPAVEIASS